MRPGRRWGLDAASAGALVLAVSLHALWIVALIETWSTPEIERRDYRVFWDAGHRFLHGELAGIYDAHPGGFPFLHPPPAIVLSTPLGFVSERTAYALVTALSFLALALAVHALRRLAPRGDALDVVVLIVLASAPWAIALVLGQPIALLLAALAVGLAMLRAERPIAAGLAWSLLFLKPQLAIAPLAFALVTQRRAALAMIAGGAGLFLLSLPAGVERWPEWIAAIARTTSDVAAARVPLWKQHTWLAWLLSVTPRVAQIGWALALVPLAIAALRAAARRSLLRAGALIALATVALAPYAYFYDALLLAVPVASLALDRDAYPRRAWIALAVLAAITLVAEHASFFALQRGPAVSGLLVTAWLAIELGAAPEEAARPA